ncbi:MULTISPECIES: DUF2087 domain-containing protein [unclassified Actinobaculum]|uniref:DUF2087 domain-containing protein n=1 Tax=unclassified Actinobaculum TaxID=2609299 RepID=UPI000D526362|nr:MULTISPECIES: DUF2087 domain-containing protein [unclassified Actinobaculum]AWE42751.1 hypothetical protein DDD63_08355 [Actinobaculum sp. 313]RTE49566.1 DUF2087 domain-containing protein [Actinobaculum sp. 352]
MVAQPVSEIRLLLNVLCAPSLRKELAAVLSGDRTQSAPVNRLSFVDATGLNADALQQLRAAVTEALDVEAIFEQGPIELPVQERRRLPLARRACEEVFRRNRWQSCTEVELNAALAVFVDDVALARRDCVDNGILQRDAGGRRYRLATTP